MNKLKILVPCVAFVMQGCVQLNSTSNHEELKILGGQKITYLCKGDDRVVVQYYSLSDASLSFAKLSLQGMPEITLASSLSASGSRYANESFEWLENGGKALVRVRDQNKKWQPLYENCSAIVSHE